MPGHTAAGTAQAGDKHSIPILLTSFVGREREMRALAQVLDPAAAGPRLLTLAGVGGSGKTRLAVEVAARVAGGYADGVCLVDIVAVADPELVLPSVARAVGVRDSPGRSTLACLIDFLTDKRLLMLVDNCEHLAQACGALAQALLQACPALRLLATSRQPLGLAGEAVWRVPPLAVPHTGEVLPVDDLAQFDAVRLFVERARLAQPAFQLTSQSASAVAMITRQLDGLPLAIELAAARLNLLSLEQIASRLDDRFRLLAATGPAVPARHRTLWNVADWSYELLSPAGQALFRRLGVFAGGFSLEAAEAVGGASDDLGGDSNDSGRTARQAARRLRREDVLDLLASLVDRSLVLVETATGGAARYRLLETLRRYAEAQLIKKREADDARRAHGAFFLAMAEQAEREVRGRDQVAWLEQLEREHDNLRTALAWFQQQDADAGLRLAAALAGFWGLRGYVSEGRRWLESMLARSPAPTIVRSRALRGAGVLARMQGDFAQDRAHCEECLAISRELGDAGAVAAALFWRGTLAWARTAITSGRGSSTRRAWCCFGSWEMCAGSRVRC